MKRIIINIAIAGVFGFIISFAINQLTPIPETRMQHALANGISGLMSGLMGVLMFFVTNKDVREQM